MKDSVRYVRTTAWKTRLAGADSSLVVVVVAVVVVIYFPPSPRRSIVVGAFGVAGSAFASCRRDCGVGVGETASDRSADVSDGATATPSGEYCATGCEIPEAPPPHPSCTSHTNIHPSTSRHLMTSACLQIS